MSDSQTTVPYGYCECGCGRKTEIRKTDCSCGKSPAGEPQRYVSGHARRVKGPDYIIEDRGFTSPCWIWQGYTEQTGYSRITVNGKRWRAHRWMYEEKVGPIPEGLTLDHLCSVRQCVNPGHLEPVTAAENSLRGNSPWAKNKRKTHCKHGHPFDEENTAYGDSGYRICRACRAMKQSKKKRKR